MRKLDLLSDTVYREQACKQLDNLLEEHKKVPVQKAQLYGLRQITRQQPGRVVEFAEHQRRRAERKLETASKPSAQSDLQAEIGFWALVEKLCNATSGWSVRKQGLEHAPTELRDENFPPRHPGMTLTDRTNRKQLKRRQQEWIDRWNEEHIPAFFERFCTHALYRHETPEGKLVRKRTVEN